MVDIPTLKIRQPHILCVLQRRAWLSPPGSLSCSPHPNLSKRKKRTGFTGYTPPPPSLLTLLHFFLSPPPPVSFSLRSSTFLPSLFHFPTLNSSLLRPPPLLISYLAGGICNYKLTSKSLNPSEHAAKKKKNHDGELLQYKGRHYWHTLTS